MFTKPDAIKVVCNASKIYHKKLANKNFLVLYKNRSNNAVESFEALFLPRNFLHLTGLTYINPKNSSDFYRKCLSNNLSEDDFTFKEDGTTDLKLKALPQIVNFFQMSKMTTLYSNTQPRLYTERLAGNVTACVGFIVDDNNGYYVPNTCLLASGYPNTWRANKSNTCYFIKACIKRILFVFDYRISGKRYIG